MYKDSTLFLGDETNKIFLTTCGTLNDVDDEMLEFLSYLKSSTDEVAKHCKSKMIQQLNERVKYIKTDKRTEVEYMTLLERDEKNHEQGFREGEEKTKLENARALLDVLDDETIAKKIGLPIKTVQQMRLESLKNNE